MMVGLSIKRVVSVFVLRPKHPPASSRVEPPQLQVALFRRCDTMPTFPSHWAGISGSLETDDANPLAAAVRELGEETNLRELFEAHSGGEGTGGMRACMKEGVHMDVRKEQARGAFGGRIIRVYPFALELPSSSSLWSNIEMRGTEHDHMKFMDVDDFLGMSEPCVPSLRLAFHHSTFGAYLKLPKEIRTWEEDRVNGAAFLARRAVTLAAAQAASNDEDGRADATDGQPSMAKSIAMLRPSMVPIVNVMNEFDRRIQSNEDGEKVRVELLLSLDTEGQRCVDLAVESVLEYYKQWQVNSPPAELTFTIGTFSRSSTLKSILERVLRTLEQTKHVRVVCSRSTPGNEGELMASDIPNVTWLADESFQQRIEQGGINLVVVGADCILSEGKGVVNKVGTAALASACKRSNVPIICCADRWKLWEDDYPPPLEDIFELVPSSLLDRVIVPAAA